MKKDTRMTQVVLENGLKVFLKEIHTAPIISHWIWYCVGSRNEIPGITGVSHWVEHMQFKGTPKFPANTLDREIARKGGYWNAYTSMDWTTYFETMPADQIDLSLQIEADRMSNSLFSPEEVEAERTVIISERQGSENEPAFRLSEELQAAAFRIHSYHTNVIGDLVDLQNIQRDELYNHYRTYYIPNNAVLSIAGDFETDAILARVREVYGDIPAGAPPELRLRPEPEQKGERRVTVEGPGETTYLQVAHHAPPPTHSSDFFPLAVLGSLLTGPSNLNIFGGGISNKTSRLYRALVDQEIAVGVSGRLHATIDPYLQGITVIVHPDSTVEAALAVIDDEIKRLQDELVTEDELEQALKQARALFAYSSESITSQAFWMGFSEMFASYEWFTQFLEKLARVTAEDIRQAARDYLTSRNRIVGVYLPTNHTSESAS